MKHYVPWAKPEEHDRVELVDVWDGEDWKHEEEQEVPQDEICRKHAEFRDLAEILSAWLRKRAPAHRIPFASPPSDVCRIRSELTSQSQGDDQFEDKSLQSNDSNHAQQSSCEYPSFQKEHDFKEGKQHDHSHTMCNSCEDRPKFLATHTEDRTHTAGHTEKACQDARINSDGSECNCGNTDERASGLGAPDPSLCIDEEVWDKGHGNQQQRTQNLGNKDVGKMSSRHITRQLRRRLSKLLLLVPDDTCS